MRTHTSSRPSSAAFGTYVANRSRVARRVTRGEALVRAVKERNVVLRLHHVRNLLPLLDRRVHARRVVRTRVEQEERALWCTLEVADEPREVETARRRLVVRVLADFETRVLHDRDVVAPRRVRHVDRRALAKELGEELTRETNTARARDRLCSQDAAAILDITEIVSTRVTSLCDHDHTHNIVAHCRSVVPGRQ